MKRRAFLKSSVVGVSGLTGMAVPAWISSNTAT